jgi:hypothetical protein
MMWLAGMSVSAPERGFAFDDPLMKDWQGMSVRMPTLASVLLPILGMDEHGMMNFKLDLSEMTTCTPLDYPSAGCLVQAKLARILSVPFDMTLGIQPCFGTEPAVPLGSLSLIVRGENLMEALGIRRCSRNADCLPGWECDDAFSSLLRENIKDYFDEIVSGARKSGKLGCSGQSCPLEDRGNCSNCGQWVRPGPSQCYSKFNSICSAGSPISVDDRGARAASPYPEIAGDYFRCDTKVEENKFARDVLEWFADSKGSTSSEDFSFCLPRLSSSLVLEDAAQIATRTYEKADGDFAETQVWKFPFLAPSDMETSSDLELHSPSEIVFVFPPARGYKWPLGRTRLVSWAEFHMPSDLGQLTLSLHKGTAVIDSVPVVNQARALRRTSSLSYEIPPGTARGHKFHMSLCSSADHCWQSGIFSVVEVLGAAQAPAEYKLLMPGDAQSLLPPEVLSRFTACLHVWVRDKMCSCRGIQTHFFLVKHEKPYRYRAGLTSALASVLGIGIHMVEVGFHRAKLHALNRPLIA